jgi:hypothetical protein
LPGATYQFLTNSSIFLNSCCATEFFENQGLLWQSGGTNATTISIPFDNEGGDIRVDTGNLTLSGGGTSSNCVFTVAVGASVDLTGGGSTTWSGQMSGSGEGAILLSHGTLSANPNLTLDFTNVLFNWSAGAIAGTVTNAGTVLLTGTQSSVMLNQSTFVNESLVQEEAGGGLGFNGYGGGTTAFYNLPGATYEFLTNSSIYLNNCCGTEFFENQGLLWQEGGTNATTISLNFNNLGGTIEVDAGKLVLSGQGRSSSGTFNVASGAVVDLTGGNTPVWTGVLNGGGGGQVLLSSGTLLATPNLTLDFTNGLFNWNGGAIDGLITNAGIVILSGTEADSILNQSTFVNEGLVQEQGAGGVALNGYGGGTTAIYNLPGATYQFLTNSSIYLNNCCGTVFFENQGLLWQSGGTNATTISIPFDSLGGVVRVDTGNLNLNGGGSSSNGVFTVAAGASVDLTGGGSATWSGQMSGSGQGAVLLSHGTLVGRQNLTLDFSNSVFQWMGGILTGAATNTGTIVITGTNDSIMANQSTLYNNGLIVHSGSGGLGLNGYGGGTTAFYNLSRGIYEFTADSSVFVNDCCGTELFQNQGLLWKKAGTNTSAISVPFANAGGSIEVDSGTLSLGGSSYSQGGGVLNISLGGTNTGQYGQLLTSSSASLGGPLNISLADGFVPVLGNQFKILSCSGLSGTFTGTNIGGISVVYNSGGVTLVVTSTVVGPVVSWTPPSAITYGTALSSNQLNATASVPGAFAYTPISGTLLNAGAHTLSVVFNPTDTVHYSSVSETVNLTVSPAPLTIKATNLSMPYGSIVPPLTASYSGFVNGENTSTLNGVAALSTTATSSSPIGTYPINVALGTINDSNYTYIFVPGTLTIQQSACTPAGPGLISWWPGNGNALDVVGGNDGTLTNGADFAAGEVGQAFNFSVNHAGVLVGNPTNLQLQNFTIEAWIRRGSANFVTDDPTAYEGGASLFFHGSQGYGLGIQTNGALYLAKTDVDSVSAGPGVTERRGGPQLQHRLCAGHADDQSGAADHHRQQRRAKLTGRRRLAGHGL